MSRIRRMVLAHVATTLALLATGLTRVSERPRRTLPKLALSAAVLFALCAGVAQAEVPRLISDGSFPATFPEGVAVDNSNDTSSGDVYVAALAAANINKFDGSVPPSLISPPSPFGEGNFSGAAVNPVNGDVYVIATVGHEIEVRPGELETVYEAAIETYDPSGGALLSSFEVPLSQNQRGLNYTIMQIAADSAGNVYVPVVSQNEVLEYSQAGTLLKTFTGGSGSGALKGPTGVAVDSAGNLWVADSGDNRIEKLSPADVQLAQIKSEGVQDAIALDGQGDVFAIVKNGQDSCGSLTPPCSHLVEYDGAGAQVADVGAASFEAGGGPTLPPMVAVAEASGRVYVSDASGGKVWVFALPTTPHVEKEFSAEVSTSEAKLGALVNPGGIPTTYRFEYDTREYKEGEAPHGQSTPLPEGSVGEGLTSHAVWGAASGLAPGTTYHYRVVATNELAPEGVAGPDQTFTTETAEQAACPNEQFRGGFSARLPDCRAYELVTPPVENSAYFESALPAANGNSVSLSTLEPLPDAPAGGYAYVATRGAGGWASEDMIPLYSYTGTACSQDAAAAVAFSSKPSQAVVKVGEATSTSSGLPDFQKCNTEGVEVVRGEPLGYENLLLREGPGVYELINAFDHAPSGAIPANAKFQGASADLSHIVFSEQAPLTRNAPYGAEDFYEWDEGTLRLLTVLPDGSPAIGSLAESNGESGNQAVSSDGSHILFEAGGDLYERIDGKHTIEVDEKAQGGSGASGGGRFVTASADGSKIFFLDDSKLTHGASAESGEPDMYECEVVETGGEPTCRLSDLTNEVKLAKAGEHADVQKVSFVGSQDSSYVYFLAKGVLAANKRVYIDSKGNEVEEGAVDGEHNLYLWDGGTTTFIATLGVDEDKSGESMVSPDGTWFAFDSSRALTGYDNVSSNSNPVTEIFLYSATSQQLVCASCDPSGEAPLPGANVSLASNAQRPLADGGRLFFQTLEALVPSDTNNQLDVYEYEDGQPSLISSGTSASASTFQGASESGADVFFVAHQQLVPQDTQKEGTVIYDARVGGGFPAVVSPPPCTTADACRVSVSPLPSVFGAPASATFSGAGNLSPAGRAPNQPAVKPKARALTCKRGFVKEKVMRKVKNKGERKTVCVKKRVRKAKKSAHANKRTGK